MLRKYEKLVNREQNSPGTYKCVLKMFVNRILFLVDVNVLALGFMYMIKVNY